MADFFTQDGGSKRRMRCDDCDYDECPSCFKKNYVLVCTSSQYQTDSPFILQPDIHMLRTLGRWPIRQRVPRILKLLPPLDPRVMTVSNNYYNWPIHADNPDNSNRYNKGIRVMTPIPKINLRILLATPSHIKPNRAESDNPNNILQ